MMNSIVTIYHAKRLSNLSSTIRKAKKFSADVRSINIWMQNKGLKSKKYLRMP